MNQVTSQNYLTVIALVVDRILRRGEMQRHLEAMRNQRRLEVLRIRDKSNPSRAGIELPAFLERHV